MPKKEDSFFIRHTVTTNAALFTQEAIDLGAFVDALGMSILKVHSVSVQYQNQADPARHIQPTKQSTCKLSWQLTTQSQSSIISLGERTVFGSGHLVVGENANTDYAPTICYETEDANAQTWRNGYAIAVDQVYLGVDKSATLYNSEEVDITVLLECTVERLNKESALALALSQQ